jgi:uncharacterized membrane protein SirB2
MVGSLQIGLLLHIIGLATVVGVTLVRYIIVRKFWTQYKRDNKKGMAIMQATAALPRMAAIGLLLLILSGIMMLASLGGVYGHQDWFRIKMIIVVLIIAGTIFLNRVWKDACVSGCQMMLYLGTRPQQIGKIVGTISYVQLSMLFLFTIIFILSIFRFN